MKQTITILGIILLSIFLIGCTDSPVVVDDSHATSEGVQGVIDANNQFAFDLYSEFKKEEEGNIFFSPYSISTALAMTYEGARGETAEEMQSVFYFPEDDMDRMSSFAKLYNQINKKDKGYKLHTANALWAEQNYEFLDEYFNVVEDYYGGKVTNLDFRGETEKSRVTINNWVEDQTNNKIKDIIPRGVITSDTRLVLTNAIYFKGEWVKQFDKDNTRERDFRKSPDETVRVDMMSLRGKEAEFNYAETDELQILEMPYDDEELSMIIMLPKEDFAEIDLDVEKLKLFKGMLSERRVDVYLPKFKFETKYFMAKNLIEMGMPTAFSMNADFSGMNGKGNLYISSVIHQAFVDVNEEGTEAAAATAVVVTEMSAEPSHPTFYADHPFVFMIQEKETGAILFMGKVVDPGAEE